MGLKSYKYDDPRGRQSTDEFLHTQEIEEERMYFCDDFMEAPAALASTGNSKVYWTGSGTNGTQAIIAGANGLLQLDTSATASSTSIVDFTAANLSVLKNPSFEARTAVTDRTNTKSTVGLYASANDYLMLRYDSAVSNNLLVATNNNGAGEVLVDTKLPAYNLVFTKFRIDVFADTSFRIYANNTLIKGAFGTIRALTTFKPRLYIDNKAIAASKLMQIDYVKLNQDRS